MKKNIRKMKSGAFVMGLSLMALTACNGTGPSITPARGNVEADRIAEGDSWKAKLSSVNSRFGSGSGEATFKREGDKLIVEVETSGLKEVAHIQTVRKGACPGEAADTNDDDIVDASELGQEPALLILENNPTSDVTGNYFYSATIDQTVLGEEDLSAKIVVIHGIAAEESLPNTVKGLGQDDQHETMPVLCGSLMKDDSSEDGQQDQQPPHQQQQQQTQDMISVSMPELE